MAALIFLLLFKNYVKTPLVIIIATAHNANNSIPTSDYPLHYQTPLSNYMTSIANDDNSSIAFIDEDPPPYAVHCMLFYHNWKPCEMITQWVGLPNLNPILQTKVVLGLNPIKGGKYQDQEFSCSIEFAYLKAFQKNSGPLIGAKN